LTNRSIETLIPDIYAYANGIGTTPVNVAEIIEGFKTECENILARFINERDTPRGPHRLRPSNLGTPPRKLWFVVNTEHSQEPDPESYRPLTFLLGSMTEALVLALTRLSGHTVEDQQKRVGIADIEGSIDAVIDGKLVDVKSASPYSFNSVKNGSLTSGRSEDDPWGYRDQASFYARANGVDDFFWLTFDKSSGELMLTKFDALSGMKSAKTLEAQIAATKEMLAKPSPPSELCYQPQPDGKSGNEMIHKLCSMCAFKSTCFPNARVFKYANGLKYLTKVVKVPDVEEVTAP